MDYLHIKNLDKHNPGYKDRDLRWAKIQFNMAQGDPDCDMIEDEIDWARLVKFILLEMQAKQPIPLDNKYLEKKGFNLKKRPIHLTIQMLHNFVDIVTQEKNSCTLDKSRVDKIRVEEMDTKPSLFKKPSLTDLNKYIQESGFSVDAGNFLDFYESKGWLIGKNKMKDWKAAVRTWEKRSPNKENKGWI